MKVTRDIIACQKFDFKFTEKKGRFTVFAKSIDDLFCVLFWIDNSETLVVHHFPTIGEDKEKCLFLAKVLAMKMLTMVNNDEVECDNNDDSIVFFGKVPNLLVLLNIFVEFNVIQNGNLSIPLDIDERFINSDYEYDEETFDVMYKMLIHLFNEHEDYEKAQKVWTHYTNVRKEKNWANEFHH